MSDDYRNSLYRDYRSHQGVAGVDDRGARASFLRDVVRRHFPPDRDARILDLGCGSGTLLHFLREAGYRSALGVDRSPEQVAAARAASIEGVREGDLFEELASTAPGSLDVVVTWDVIEHFGKAEILPFAREVGRVLSRRGRWIVHVPNAESPFGARARYADLTHELAFTRESLSQLARAAGFGRVECFEDAPVVHGIRSLVRWVLWRFARVLLRLYVAAETGDPGGRSVFTQNILAVVHFE